MILSVNLQLPKDTHYLELYEAYIFLLEISMASNKISVFGLKVDTIDCTPEDSATRAMLNAKSLSLFRQ